MPKDTRAFFAPDQLSLLSKYAELLGTEGIERGLVGPSEATRIWSRHILNCAALATIIPPLGEILDLGSGAGLPGVVIAILRPQQQVVLLEPLLRRSKWLVEVTEYLELSNTRVVRGRAEDEFSRLATDYVVCRAVARLPQLLAWSRPLLRPNGELIALKGSGVVEEIAEVSARDRKSWKWPPEVVELSPYPGVTPTTAIRLQRK